MTKKHGSIIAFASVAVLAFVLLITQSIYMHAAVKSPGTDASATVGITFVILAIVALAGSFFFFHVKDENLYGFIALAVAVLFLIIAFAVPMADQKDLHKMWTDYPQVLKDKAPTYFKDAANVFVPNVVFFSLGLVGATAGTALYFAK